MHAAIAVGSARPRSCSMPTSVGVNDPRPAPTWYAKPAPTRARDRRKALGQIAGHDPEVAGAEESHRQRADPQQQLVSS